ncbi:MAG: ribbon-helix-helix domain-containing protein [Candidatus Bathyarchaeia archaeon]
MGLPLSQVIPVRVPKRVLEKVQLLVRLGKYANRSEALRALLEEHLDEMSDLLAYGKANLEVEKLREVASHLKEDEFLALCRAIFEGSESSVKLVEEQRGEQAGRRVGGRTGNS